MDGEGHDSSSDPGSDVPAELFVGDTSSAGGRTPGEGPAAAAGAAPGEPRAGTHSTVFDLWDAQLARQSRSSSASGQRQRQIHSCPAAWDIIAADPGWQGQVRSSFNPFLGLAAGAADSQATAAGLAPDWGAQRIDDRGSGSPVSASHPPDCESSPPASGGAERSPEFPLPELCAPEHADSANLAPAEPAPVLPLPAAHAGTSSSPVAAGCAAAALQGSPGSAAPAGSLIVSSTSPIASPVPDSLAELDGGEDMEDDEDGERRPLQVQLTPTCQHNEWERALKKRHSITLRCRVCHAYWKTRLAMFTKCQAFYQGNCPLGGACPHPHIYSRCTERHMQTTQAPGKAGAADRAAARAGKTRSMDNRPRTAEQSIRPGKNVVSTAAAVVSSSGGSSEQVTIIKEPGVSLGLELGQDMTVLAVAPSSPAATLGLQRFHGWRLTTVNGDRFIEPGIASVAIRHSRDCQLGFSEGPRRNAAPPRQQQRGRQESPLLQQAAQPVHAQQHHVVAPQQMARPLGEVVATEVTSMMGGTQPQLQAAQPVVLAGHFPQQQHQMQPQQQQPRVALAQPQMQAQQQALFPAAPQFSMLPSAVAPGQVQLLPVHSTQAPAVMSYAVLPIPAARQV
eukprot:TRINITY_DN2173_c0_g1_i1.p1 TRINITY_DN2173_c0_g1~~TRINITY_DN2173_c0_g1_i1.p1  ORF type:complete len:622 (+),score=135.64 TRINITY_DN2173_c0_g1_i1:78-1943(+)